jgi:hypothetical protein
MHSTTKFGILSDIDSTHYTEFKTNVLENYPYKKLVKLNEFDLIDTSNLYHKGTKQTFGFTQNVFIDFLKIMKIPQATTINFNNSIGDTNTIKLLNTLRKAMSLQRNKEYAFLIDKQTNTITSITQTRELLPQNIIFDFLENNSQGLQLDLLTFDEERGEVSINCRTDFEVCIPEISNVENYLAGVSLNLSPNGFSADSYLLRVLCTNGLIAKTAQKKSILKKLEKNSWDNFVSKFNDMKSKNFMDNKIFDKIKTANTTAASLQELRKVVNILDEHIPTRETSKIVDFETTYSKFSDKGFDVDKMLVATAQRYRTDITVKTLVDTLTDVSSHSDLYKLSTRAVNKLQGAASELLLKDVYDTMRIEVQIF